MSRKKQPVCRQYRCDKPPLSNGLCHEHYEIHKHNEKSREEALEALHKAHIDGALPTNTSLREQLFQIQKWWFRACDSLNYNRKDPVLLDEAQYALDWCISLAKEIVAAERAINSGQEPSWTLEHTSNWVYERFHKLEKGLMSNGVVRPAK